MPLHTKKQFADLCGIKTGDLSNYQKRGKVSYSGDYIDDAIEPNISFLKKALDKKNGCQVPETPKEETLPLTKELTTLNISEPKIRTPKAPNVKPPKEKEATGYNLGINKTALQIENLELKNRELEQKLNVKLGEYIPRAPVLVTFKYHAKNIAVAFKNSMEGILTRYANNFTNEEMASIRALLTEEINHSQRSAIEQTKKSISEIIAISSNKKEVGERE